MQTKITIDNIENFLKFNQAKLEDITWVEPIYIASLKAHLDDNKKDLNIENSYIKTMLNSTYQKGKTYTPIVNINSRKEIEQTSENLLKILTIYLVRINKI